MYYFNKCNKKIGHRVRERAAIHSIHPIQSLVIFAFRYKFIWPVIGMSAGDRSYINKAELRKSYA